MPHPLSRARRALPALFATLLAALLPAAAPATAAPPLPALGARLEGITVSGISSGGAMAVQFQVAHSSLVAGAGVLAAPPYDCAEGSMWRALRNCMAPEPGSPPPDTERTLARIALHARAGRIDPPAGLREDRAWVMSGEEDKTVASAVVERLVGMYRSQLPQEALRYRRLEGAGHAMITVADPEARACASSEPPFMNRCGRFDAPGELLAHLLGRLAPRAATPAGELVSFDQAAFTDRAPLDLSLADQGYVYIPPGCREGGCAVHVAFHGCRQSEAQIGRRFVAGAGYNEWADANRLIVLYPQTRARDGFAWGSWRWVFNPRGCWDWWGYTDPGYATREGAQIRAVRGMLERLGAAPAPGG